MSSDTSENNLKTYWRIWGMLLALTLVMLVIDASPLPRVPFIIIMVSAMLVKAGLIAAFFMHLKYESRFLQAMVIIGLFVMGAFMFALMVPDAVRIYGMMHG